MNREEHMATDKLLLGYTDEGVHAFIDHSAAWLGFGHRSVRHTTETIEYLEMMKGNKAGRIALLHILIDNQIMDAKWLKNTSTETGEGEADVT
ncbi:uncharacterized protein Hqrw_5037 (plasmid) [Haloquadratum walsbyi C23]|uniref:Uncharacterized protein n=2 Tax=Haloquadratum walsbyi TaxID=293091 RepID=G0LNA7_HALWC|nr:uncharacterized protein Hqrw_5037 [Haloquadratum walsbyi C23]